MFKKNEAYKQLDAFAVSNNLSKRQQKLWDKSKEHRFFHEVFSQIDEQAFSVLYSASMSRPNVAVNQMVGALILKHLYNWTYQALFTNLNFNLLTRHALGINTLEEDIFCEASIYNFQNKLIAYYDESGVDLLEGVFCQLTKNQIDYFNVDTSVQRGDSFLVGSNIVDYTELRLLVEVLLRFYRTLTKEEKDSFKALLEPYLAGTSSQYIYQLKREDLPAQMNQIGKLYHQLIIDFKEKHNEQKQYQILVRVFNDRFNYSEQTAIIEKTKPKSNAIQSPDDLEATFRFKAGSTSKGYVSHISETINSNNKVNLITDVVVKPNNVGDEKILEERLPEMIINTPQLEEYYVDGAYASQVVDGIAKEEEILIYQKNFKGRKSSAGIEIVKEGKGYKISCKGGQKIQASIIGNKEQNTFKGSAFFDYNKCLKCPYLKECKLTEVGGKLKPKRKLYYFGQKEIMLYERRKRSREMPKEKRNMRANVEATVKEMKRGMKNGKVRIRQRRRISSHMILTAIGINFTRIWAKTIIYLESSILKILEVSQYKIKNYQSFISQ